jgi:hypothetical protein
LAQLNWYLENQNLRTEEQAGFLTKQINNVQANKVTQRIKRVFNQQESVLTVFVDFSGACDSIRRAKLIEKLKNMNNEGNMLLWFSTFVDHRWPKVKYGKTFQNINRQK